MKSALVRGRLSPQLCRFHDKEKGFFPIHFYPTTSEYSSQDDADYHAYSRADDSSHKGLMPLLNDNGSAKNKPLASPWKNAKLVDKTGNYLGIVITDANGNGNFPLNGRNWLVWVVR